MRVASCFELSESFLMMTHVFVGLVFRCSYATLGFSEQYFVSRDELDRFLLIFCDIIYAFPPSRVRILCSSFICIPLLHPV
jgi:hypothetical protein